jgi:hypothetical protein
VLSIGPQQLPQELPQVHFIGPNSFPRSFYRLLGANSQQLPGDSKSPGLVSFKDGFGAAPTKEKRRVGLGVDDSENSNDHRMLIQLGTAFYYIHFRSSSSSSVSMVAHGIQIISSEEDWRMQCSTKSPQRLTTPLE